MRRHGAAAPCLLLRRAGWLPVRRLQLDGPKLEHANSRGSRHITTAALVVRILGGSGLGFRHAYRGFLRFFSASFGVLSDGGVRLSENPAVSFGILRYPRRAWGRFSEGYRGILRYPWRSWGTIFKRIPRYPSVSLVGFGSKNLQGYRRYPSVSSYPLVTSGSGGRVRPGILRYPWSVLGLEIRAWGRYPSVSLCGFGAGFPPDSRGILRYPSVSLCRSAYILPNRFAPDARRGHDRQRSQRFAPNARSGQDRQRFSFCFFCQGLGFRV